MYSQPSPTNFILLVPSMHKVVPLRISFKKEGAILIENSPLPSYSASTSSSNQATSHSDTTLNLPPSNSNITSSSTAVLRADKITALLRTSSMVSGNTSLLPSSFNQ